MLIFRWVVATTHLKHVFDIESFIQEIPTVKQVYMKWDTDSLIVCKIVKKKQVYIYLKDLNNEPFIQNH